MLKHKIKTATACYTGGNLYIYYGQLESGLYFMAYDDWEVIYICDSDTEAEEAQYDEFYEKHALEELSGKDFVAFWNLMLNHIISGKPAHGCHSNYLNSDLEIRIIK